MKKRAKSKKYENLWNIPNTLTFIRVIITFIAIYAVFAGYSLINVAALFIIGMLTDFLDGQIARRFNQVTEFGRKFDIIADRMLFIGTAVALIVSFSAQGIIERFHILQIFMMLSREIISAPFAIISFASNKPIPHARFIGKLTTFLQGFALPAILLSIYYPFFEFSFYLALLTSIVGIFSAIAFIRDIGKKGIR